MGWRGGEGREMEGVGKAREDWQGLEAKEEIRHRSP